MENVFHTVFNFVYYPCVFVAMVLFCVWIWSVICENMAYVEKTKATARLLKLRADAMENEKHD